MYLNKLSDIEKNAFFSVAQAMAAAHEGVSVLEEAILNAALGEMQIQRPEKIQPLSDALNQFQSEDSKRLVLLELMLIAMVDDDFAEAEQSVIEEVIETFKLTESHVERAATWAEGMLALFRSGQRFIEFA